VGGVVLVLDPDGWINGKVAVAVAAAASGCR
jgi:hypothetical protein